MNQELAACIRIAISDTINQLRPPVMGAGLPEPIRTALQAHLEVLLAAEREALTGRWVEKSRSIDIAVDTTHLSAELSKMQAAVAELKTQHAEAPWYPDDSGEWIEGRPRDLPPTTRIADWLFDYERDNKRYVPACEAHPASDICAGHKVVAYKVAKP